MSTRERRGSLISKTKDRNHDERRSPRMLRTKTPSVNELRKKYKESPKGKRKLNFLAKGPLTGKSFYLDLHGYRYLAQMKKAIKQLSGAVEEFFHKDVNYLVTNRINVENGTSPSSQSAPSPATPSPLFVSQSSSIKSTAVPSPMSTDSPQGIENRQPKPSHNTRGQAICNRVSGRQKRGTTDVLSNANTWGVNVFHVDRVMKWLAKLISATAEVASGKHQSSSKTARVVQGRVPKIVALQETYLKVEDLSFKYRPLVHEFKLWPGITFDGCVCPFDPSRRRVSQNNSKEKKKVDKSFKRIPIAQRPQHGYCECCEVRYTDLRTHLKGKQHQNFAKTHSHYSSLDKAIDNGGTIEEFLNEVRSMKNSVYVMEPTKNEHLLPSDQEMNDDVFLLSSATKSRQKKEINALCDKPNENFIMKDVNKSGSLSTGSSSASRQVNSVKRRSHSVSSHKKTAARGSRLTTEPSYTDCENGTGKNLATDEKNTIVGNSPRDKQVDGEQHSQLTCSKTSTGSPSRHNKTNLLGCSMSLNKIPLKKSELCSPVAQDKKVQIEGRSSCRRRRYSGLQLSPILPCSATVRRSVSSCSVEGNFLPSGLSIYSSLGSSLGEVSRDIKSLVNRIENHCDSDFNGDDIDKKNTELTSPVTKTPPKSRTINICPGSAWDVNSNHDVKSEKAPHTPLVKRKRSPNDEVNNQTKGRKCKRLSTPFSSLSESLIDDDDGFRSSVAERVKLQRALSESIQDANISHSEKGSPSSASKTCLKRRDMHFSSPFAELTNKYPCHRSRAKSDGKMSNTENRWGKTCRSKVPKSACLTPNDPFNFIE